MDYNVVVNRPKWNQSTDKAVQSIVFEAKKLKQQQLIETNGLPHRQIVHQPFQSRQINIVRERKFDGKYNLEPDYFNQTPSHFVSRKRRADGACTILMEPAYNKLLAVDNKTCPSTAHYNTDLVNSSAYNYSSSNPLATYCYDDEENSQASNKAVSPIVSFMSQGKSYSQTGLPCSTKQLYSSNTDEAARANNSEKTSPIPDFIAKHMPIKEKVVTLMSTAIDTSTDYIDSLVEEAEPEMEEPVRNSAFWLYRSFPHIC